MKFSYLIIMSIVIHAAVCNAADVSNAIKPGHEHTMLHESSDYTAEETFIICQAIHQLLQQKERQVIIEMAHEKIENNHLPITKRRKRLQLLALDFQELFEAVDKRVAKLPRSEKLKRTKRMMRCTPEHHAITIFD